MKQLLGEIQDGAFAREWIAEYDARPAEVQRVQEQGDEHPSETTGSELRKLMSWVDDEA